MFKNKMSDEWYARKDETIHLGVYGIVVKVGFSESGITDQIPRREVTEMDSPADRDYKLTRNAMLDGVMATVLGHACAKVRVDSIEYVDGVQEAVNACLGVEA